MTGGEIVLIVSAAGALISAVAVLLKGRGENRNKAAEVYSAAEEMVAKRVKTDLADAYSRIDSLETWKAETEPQVSALQIQHRNDHRQMTEMMRHIIALEPLIPNPPGPPTRPAWKIETE